MANVAEAAEAARVWQDYIVEQPEDFYQSLIAQSECHIGGCGWVYEVEDMPLQRENESFAVAIMNSADMPVSQPHEHVGETEIYVVIKGMGEVIVGRQVRRVTSRDAIVIPPETAHYTVPHGRLVMAVINTPPINTENYRTFDTSVSHEALGFDAEQYTRFLAA